MGKITSEKLKFLSEFISNPKSVGAVAPSSIGLARKMVDWIDWSQVRHAVEYGPGTGAFTGTLLRRIQEGCKLVAVEQSELMATALRKRFPDLPVVIDSVENIGEICQREDLLPVDVIVSGLPWANFSDDQQDRILQASLEVLSPTGYFATFAYYQGLLLPAGQHFRKRLEDTFSEVRRSRLVWRNMPPAFVYRCRP